MLLSKTEINFGIYPEKGHYLSFQNSNKSYLVEWLVLKLQQLKEYKAYFQTPDFDT